VYQSAYGVALEAPAELVTFRVRATCPFPGAQPAGSHGAAAAPATSRSTRRATFAAGDGGLDVPVFRYDDLAAGQLLHGPAFVEGSESTTLVPPATELRVDGSGNMHLRSAAAAAESVPS
jgi:N-methylhydantoinase A